MALALEKRAWVMLTCLLIVDVACIVAHVLLDRGVLQNPLFSVSKDRGYPEYFQYAKESVIAMLFLALAIRRSQLIFLTWMALFIYFLVDDAFLLHEYLGRDLVRHFNIRRAWGLRGQDFGELYVSLIAAAVLFSFIGAAYLKSDTFSKKSSQGMFVLIVLLGVFGVLVDTFHRAFDVDKLVRVLLEDGGEMVVMSIILAYVYALGRVKAGDAVTAGAG